MGATQGDPRVNFDDKFTELLWWPSYPRILPSHGQVLVIAAKANVRTLAVTNLYRMVLGNAKSSRSTDARASLKSIGSTYAV